MTAILVSPAEPGKLYVAFKRLAEVAGHHVATSAAPERRGVDFMWTARGHWYGCQRKELADLYASLDDGRLALELAQMRGTIMLPTLLIERAPQWTNDGVMIASQYGQGREVTHAAWIGLQLSLSMQGVTVVHSKDHTTTCAAILAIIHWSLKAKHQTGLGRPGPTGDEWGIVGHRGFGIHILQSFPGIGPEHAARIYDTFGGVPMSWNVTREQLMAIPGIGAKRADGLLGGLRPLDPRDTAAHQ